MGTDGLGSGVDAGADVGLGLTPARALHRCARKSHSASCAPLRDIYEYSRSKWVVFPLLFLFWHKHTHNLSLCECGKFQLSEHNRTLHCNRVFQSWGGCWWTRNYVWHGNTDTLSYYHLSTYGYIILNSFSNIYILNTVVNQTTSMDVAYHFSKLQSFWVVTKLKFKNLVFVSCTCMFASNSSSSGCICCIMAT